MTTAVAIPALPAHLVQYAAQHQEENAGAAGGIKAGSWSRISIGGAKFAIKEGGESTLICDPTNPDLPKMQLELVCVGHNPMVSKTYYKGKWVEGDKDEPDCSSDDGIRPDDHVVAKESPSCATCYQNTWGSRINENGKQVKACADNKRIVVLRAEELDGSAYELSIKPSSLKDWAGYVKDLNTRGIPISAVVTLVYFDPTVTYPKLLFKFGRYLTEQEIADVNERKEGEDVKLIASPRRTGPQLPAGAIPIQPMPAPAPAPAPAPPSTPPPVAASPFAGQPPHVLAAVTAAGGLDTQPGRDTYKALTGKDYAAAVAAPAPAPAPPPPDPYEGQPPHVRLAVDAAGGIASVNGAATYKALTGKDPGVTSTATPAAAASKRPRKGASTATPEQGAAAVAPAVAPVAPTPPVTAGPSFSQAPAAQVAQAGGGGLDIEAMLKKALETPVGQ